MIDKLTLRIPLNEKVCILTDDGKAVPNFDELLRLGVRMHARDVAIDPSTFQKSVSSLSVPYESIPSSNSTVATKIFSSNQFTWPFLEVKASPAKALQGHNLFGFESISTCAQELLESVWFAYPDLRDYLDFYLTEVVEIDCTYFTRTENQSTATQVIEFLRNVSQGQTRVSRKSTETTIYWNIAADGKQTGKHKSLKVYLKHAEYMHELNELRRLEKKNNLTEVQKEKLQVMDNNELIEFSKNMVRFEATIKKRMLQKFGIPTLLTELIRYQENYDKTHSMTMCQALHKQAFSDVFKALGKKTMKLHNDSEIKQALRDKLVTVTPRGNKSYTKADKAFGLFKLIQSIGFTQARDVLSSSTFYRQLADLTTVISRAQLQNMEGNKTNVVPFIRYVEIDFNTQTPEGYVPPQSVLEERYASNKYQVKTGYLKAVGA